MRRRPWVVVLLTVGACDRFPFVIVENASSAPVRVHLSASETFGWGFCGEGSPYEDDWTVDVPSLDAELEAGWCSQLSTGEHPCATDMVALIEEVRVERDGKECLAASGAAVASLFVGDCLEMRLTLSEADLRCDGEL